MYNHGNHFDGRTFTAPFDGLYSFMSTAFNEVSKLAILRCYVNEKNVATAGQLHDINPVLMESIVMQTTLNLKKHDKATIRMNGSFTYLRTPHTTYFEGRVISIIENV